jgi:1-aminocyclopropane-1-carboxylate deaminase/D-cysteine desulfhydrase-like pyridoxal-dependent ACC family enzyme
LKLNLPTPIEEIKDYLWADRGIKVFVKRDDIIHPDISGNKWRKLKYIIEDIKTLHYSNIVSFGGVYSNHLRALSLAASNNNLSLTCIIRGDEISNDNIDFLQSHGARIVFMARDLYRKVTQDNEYHLLNDYIDDTYYIVPEGGNHPLAWRGCSEIITEMDVDFQYIYTAVGTGATLTGLAQALDSTQQVIGVSALKGEDKISDIIRKNTENNFFIDFNYHFGGYAKTTPELIRFIQEFQIKHGIPLDYVYTGKMFYAIYDRIAKNLIPDGSTLIAIHTGGISNASV